MNKKLVISLVGVPLVLLCAVAVWAASGTPTLNTNLPDPYQSNVAPIYAAGVIPSPQQTDDSKYYLLWRTRVIGYDTTTTARTIYWSESGSSFFTTTAANNDTVTFNLPTAKKGLTYTFYDTDSVASGNLKVQAASGDVVAGSAASGYVTSVNTGTTASLTIEAINTTTWAIKSRIGTWTPSS